jgi:hypothetical protein
VNNLEIFLQVRGGVLPHIEVSGLGKKEKPAKPFVLKGGGLKTA